MELVCSREGPVKSILSVAQKAHSFLLSRHPSRIHFPRTLTGHDRFPRLSSSNHSHRDKWAKCQCPLERVELTVWLIYHLLECRAAWATSDHPLPLCDPLLIWEGQFLCYQARYQTLMSSLDLDRTPSECWIYSYGSNRPQRANPWKDDRRSLDQKILQKFL